MGGGGGSCLQEIWGGWWCQRGTRSRPWTANRIWGTYAGVSWLLGLVGWGRYFEPEVRLAVALAPSKDAAVHALCVRFVENVEVEGVETEFPISDAGSWRLQPPTSNVKTSTDLEDPSVRRVCQSL